MKHYCTDAEPRTPIFPVLQNISADTFEKSEPQYCEGASEQKQPFFSGRTERWAVPAAWLLGWAYLRLVLYATDWTPAPAGLVLVPLPFFFSLLFSVSAIWFGHSAGYPRSRECLFWLACLLTASASVFFNRGHAAGALLMIFLHGCAVLLALGCTGQLTDGCSGLFLMHDLLRGLGQGFAGLLRWPVAVYHLVFERFKKTSADRKRGPAILASAAAMILLLLAAHLLSLVDDGFAALLGRLCFWEQLSFDSDSMGRILFSFPVGAFFYGLLAGGARSAQKNPRPMAQSRLARMEPIRQLSGRFTTGVLAAFCFLYLLFFCLQGSYLFGAFAGRLPEGFTVAHYARQGFFQLCQVMLLNFALLGAAELCCTQPLQSGQLRIFCTMLLVLSLLLWCTAAAKLGLYLFTFGFTPKRLMGAWALLVLGFAALRYLTRLRCSCTLMRPVLLLAAGSFALLCLY